MLRRLASDFREYPATMTLGAAWVVVFVGMVATSLAQGEMLTFGQLGLVGISSRVGHLFGDLTLGELDRGEVWRTLTCTFVHYGILHIAMNLYGLYQVGCLVESWYGSWLLAAIYVLIGAGGNLLAALARTWLGSDPSVHSGGGSTVLMGLFALCAVVGWHSRTRIGDYLHRQMVWVLILTAALGAVILLVTWLMGHMHPIIDNWGHAGGAAVGALIGLAHRPLVRIMERPVARWAGLVASVLLVASGAAQVREDRVELRWKDAERTLLTLFQARDFYSVAAQHTAYARWRFVPKAFLRVPTHRTAPASSNPTPFLFLDVTDAELRTGLERLLGMLDDARSDLDSGATDADFREVRRRLARVLNRPPTPLEQREFSGHWEALVRRARRDRDAARARFESFSFALARRGPPG